MMDGVIDVEVELSWTRIGFGLIFHEVAVLSH